MRFVLKFCSDAIAPVHFSYVGADGPAKWGSLNPAFSACSHGKLQSPIDIAKGKIVLDTNLKPLTRQYNSINATLVNYGFNVGVSMLFAPFFLSMDFGLRGFS